MKIEFYKSLNKKKDYFESTNIDTKSDLDDFMLLWNKKDNNQKIMFRGLSEAKYKLYNSAQRFWLGEELEKLNKPYLDFINDQIEYAKNYQQGLLKKFYNSFGHKAYDLSILSFLQHYGAPTPLLDFTYNLDCALYFATYQTNHFPSNGIENYFSIYAIELNKTKNEFPSIIDHLLGSADAVDEAYEKYPKEKLDASNITVPLENLSFTHFQDLKLFYIPGFRRNGYQIAIKNLPEFQLLFNQQNLNVINQNGLFIYTSDSKHPLEDYFTGSKSSFQGTHRLPKIKCWNIHKSFKEYILDKLNKKSINHDYLFPQEELIAKNAFKSYKVNL